MLLLSSLLSSVEFVPLDFNCMVISSRQLKREKVQKKMNYLHDICCCIGVQPFVHSDLADVI